MHDASDSPPPGSDRPTLGLALGGGAVLGFSHLGLLDALQEARLPVDRLAGTSAGAIVAGLFAFQVRPARIRTLISPLTWRNVSNFSRNSRALLSNEPLADVGARRARRCTAPS